MTQISRDAYARNVSTGPRMQTAKRVSSLELNLANIWVGQEDIRRVAWQKRLGAVYRSIQGPEFVDVPFSNGRPWFMGRKGQLQLELVAGRYQLGQARNSPGRYACSHTVLAVLDVLRDYPVENIVFLTVVTAICLTKEEAIATVEKSSDALGRTIANRFDQPVWAMFPEVDLVLASKINEGLLPGPSQLRDVEENRLVYKVHFHGLFAAPDITPKFVEQAFKRTPSGKLCKNYAGANQVRAISVRPVEAEGRTVPDVEGVVGYSTKTHFRPPVESRMFEGFPEWVWIVDQIKQNPRFISSGNHRDREVPQVCAKKAVVPNVTTPEETRPGMSDQQDEPGELMSEVTMVVNSGTDQGILLDINCSDPSHWESVKKTCITFSLSVCHRAAASMGMRVTMIGLSLRFIRGP